MSVALLFSGFCGTMSFWCFNSYGHSYATNRYLFSLSLGCAHISCNCLIKSILFLRIATQMLTPHAMHLNSYLSCAYRPPSIGS